MIFHKTTLSGAYIIDIEMVKDERGFFARSWCRKEFEANGLNTDFLQANISLNNKTGTLRGMHYQHAPYEEVKLVRCTKGAIYDVIADLRKDSETYGQWVSIELNEHNHRTLYIPEGFAHGFQTLEDDSEILYQHSQYYAPEASTGIRWDDPDLKIQWPDTVSRIISDRDRKLPLLSEQPASIGDQDS